MLNIYSLFNVRTGPLSLFYLCVYIYVYLDIYRSIRKHAD